MRPNKLDSNSAGLIATAGVIEREINAGRTGVPVIGNDVTLVDQGIYDGAQVRQPNYGGQWSNNFTEPVLEVQAAGRTPEIVEQRMAVMTGEISAILERRQDEAGVARSSRITLALSPAQTRIAYGRGDRRRAVGMTGLLGFATTFAAIGWVEQRRQRRITAWQQAQLERLDLAIAGRKVPV